MSKKNDKNFIEQVIRVNHAGEFGAKRIYEGQIKYLKNDDDLETVKPYGDFSTDSPNIKPGRNQVKNVGDKYQRKISKKFDDYELEEGETEEDCNGYITKADFFKKFSEWTKEHKHRELSETSIGLAMKKIGIEQEKKYFHSLRRKIFCMQTRLP
jgi:hypothetical protein